MAWSGLNLTVNGRRALTEAQLSKRLNIKSIVVGDGDPPENYNTVTGLTHQLFELTDVKVDETEDGCALTVDFPKVDYDYYFREVGVIVETEDGEKLYVYDNCGDDAQYIVNTTGAETLQKRIRLSLAISNVDQITVASPGVLYVSYADFEEHVENGTVHVTAADKTKWNGTLQDAKDYADGTYQQATGYTDKKVADLIGGAPETLNTLKEIADEIANDKSIVEALDAAIGKKADQAELDAHTKNGTIHVTQSEKNAWNGKQEKTGDSADNTVTFTSGDAASATGWKDVDVLVSKETHKSLFNKISTAISNLRYIWKLIGTTDISKIGGGTLTGAVSKIDSDLTAGAASALLAKNLSASRALVSDASGKVAAHGTVTSTELGYLDGATSNIQGQIGTLGSLGTTAKGSLVAAINELNTGTAIELSTSIGLSKHEYIQNNAYITRMGRLVIIDLNTNISGTFPSWQTVGIIYGLPKPLCKGTMAVFSDGNGNPFRVTVDENGVLNLYLPYSTLESSLSGQIVYVTKG